MSKVKQGGPSGLPSQLPSARPGEGPAAEAPALAFGGFVAQAFHAPGAGSAALQSMSDALGLAGRGFALDGFGQGAAQFLSGQTPYVAAHTVSQGMQQATEAAIAWGQQSEQLQNPSLFRSTMHPHQQQLQGALAQVPKDTKPGPGWSQFCGAAHGFAEGFQGMQEMLVDPQGAPEVQGFLGIAAGLAQAAQQVLMPTAQATQGPLSARAPRGGGLQPSLSAQHLQLKASQAQDPLGQLMQPGPPPSLPQLQQELQQCIDQLQQMAGGQAPSQGDMQQLMDAMSQAQPLPLQPGRPDAGMLTPEAAMQTLHAVMQAFVQQLQAAPRALEQRGPHTVAPSHGYIGAQSRALLSHFAGPQCLSAGPPAPMLPGMGAAQAPPSFLSIEQILAQNPQAAGGGFAPPAASPGSQLHPGVTDPGAGMPTAQAEQLRKTLDKAIKDEDEDLLKKLAKDPKTMAAATPEQKAGMIKEFVDGTTKNSEDRAILDVLESCTSKEEFDQVVALGGGKKIFDEIDHDDVKEKMSMLAGGWGRSDLATDKKAAALMEGELLQPMSSLFVASDPIAWDPALSQEPDPNAPAGERFRQLNERRIKHKAYGQINPQTHKELLMENAKRRSQGKDPLDLTELTSRMEEIRGKGLSKGKREDEIEALRKEFGISEDSMRELATHRLGTIYGESAGEAGMIAKHQLGELQSAYIQILQTEGPDSPRAEELRKEIDGLQRSAEPYIKELGAVAEHLQELYPVPKDFWESFGEIFVKILDFAAPLLNLIPGVGTALYAGYAGVKAIISAVNGDIGGVFGSIAGMLGPVGGAIGGTVGTALTTAGKVLQTGMGVAGGVQAAANGDILGAIGAFGSAGLTGAGMAGASTKTLSALRNGLNVAEGTARMGLGLAHGQWDQALAGLGGLAGGVRGLGGTALTDPKHGATRLLSAIEHGANFGSSLASGNWGGALAQAAHGFGQPEIQGLMKSVSKDPTVQRIAALAGQGVEFASHLTQGKLTGAWDTLHKTLGGLPGLDQALHQDAVKDALKYSRMGVQTLEHLTQGRLGQAMGTLGQGLAPFLGGESFQQGIQSIQHLAGAASSLARGEVTGLFRHFAQGVDGQLPLFEALGNGSIGRHLGRFAKDAQELLAQPQLQEAWGVLSQSAPMIHALTQGDVSGAFQKLAQIPAMQQFQPQLHEALDLTRQTESFTRALAGGEFFSGLSGLLQEGSPFAGLDFLQPALPMVRDASAFFGGLSSGMFAPGRRGLFGALEHMVQNYGPIHRGLQALEGRSQQLLQEGGSPSQAMRLLAQSNPALQVQPSFAIRS